MKYRFKFFYASLVLFALCLVADPVSAGTLLGISYPKENNSNHQAYAFSSQIEEASGNLIKVHNYLDKKTLVSMLTKYNKLDAALLDQDTYNKQNHQKLVALGEIQLSSESNSRVLVLAARTDLNEAQQTQLVEGYQELIMSTEGLELLERYATKPSSSVKQVAAIQVSVDQKPVKVAPKTPVVVAELPAKSTQKTVPVIKPEEKQPFKAAAVEESVPVEAVQEEVITSAKQPKPVPAPVVAPQKPIVKQTAAQPRIRVAKTNKEIPVEVIPNETPVSAGQPKPVAKPVVVKKKPKPVIVAQAPKKQEVKQSVTPRVAKQNSAAKKTSRSALKKQQWLPHIDIKSKLGNDRSLTEAELFFPYKQTLNSLLFLDLRFQFDDNNSLEGNFGLGYREFISDKWIVGGYGFIDLRRSENDNLFGQVTLGAEALAENYDLRLNVYLAEDKDYLLAKQDSLDQVVYLGNNLVHQTGGIAFETREKAMNGFDAEIGWRFPWFETQEVRGYLGGYYFSASGVEDISGPRGRLEIRFNDIFSWPGSLFELGGEVTHDDVRDTDYFITARARFPLMVSSKYQTPSETGLSGRMTERIQRDPDIIIAREHNDTSTTVNDENLTSTGDEILLTHVDNNTSTPGTGQFGTPCDTLGCAESNAADGSIILLYADSVFENEGITLSENQRLLGETGAHTVMTDQLDQINLPKASEGTEPAIILNAPGVAVQLADGSEVSSLDILGSTTAIEGLDIGGVNINNVNISNVDYGIYLNGLTANAPSAISSNTLENVSFDGIYIYSNDLSTVSALITENTLQNIGTDVPSTAGIFIENEGEDLRIEISDNTISGTSFAGIYLDNLTDANNFSATLNGNQVINTSPDGFSIADGISIVNGAGANEMRIFLSDNAVTGDFDSGGADYSFYNLGALLGLGVTAPNSAIGETSETAPGVVTDAIATEENTKFDGSEADILIDDLSDPPSDPITIIDQDTVPIPGQ